jgi:hypothetical protein
MGHDSARIALRYSIITSAAFIADSCGENFNHYALSQAQECPFNMESCSSCGEKTVSHTETAAEIQAEHKTETRSQTVLWQPQNHHTHIKRENTKPTHTNLNLFFDLLLNKRAVDFFEQQGQQNLKT